MRIIYDDFGSINAIPPYFIKEMESIGIQTRRFNPYKPMLSVIMNDRDHRKSTGDRRTCGAYRWLQYSR